MALDYIEQMGIGVDPEVSDTETETNKEPSNAEVTQDKLTDSANTEAKKEEPSTEQVSLMESLQKQIEGMEKRISDKDAYIEELRSISKQKEDAKETLTGDTEEDKTFWDSPEEYIEAIQAKMDAQDERLKMQDLLIKEQVYSHTVEDYWGTVNQDALKDAVATDAKFSEEFNSSAEPYKFAYEYLKNKSTADVDAKSKLREEIRAELMAELGVKEAKEAPPSMTAGKSSSSSSTTSSDDDGFASVFGIK